MKSSVKLVITQAELDDLIENRLRRLKRAQALEVLDLEKQIVRLGELLEHERSRRLGSRLRRWWRWLWTVDKQVMHRGL